MDSSENRDILTRWRLVIGKRAGEYGINIDGERIGQVCKKNVINNIIV